MSVSVNVTTTEKPRLTAEEVEVLDPYALMLRMQRAVPYLGYIVIAGTKPA
ncbi:MAG: hypothetical protein KJ077_45105 [Anaerolineae bacterium]|nr:hypothetical protein [Anaerolineae bacterium]